MSDYPMLISNKLHSFRNFMLQNTYFSFRSFSLSANALFIGIPAEELIPRNLSD